MRQGRAQSGEWHVKIVCSLECHSCPSLLCLFVAFSLACTEIFLLHSAVPFKRVHMSKVILNRVVSPTPMPILGEGDALEAIELD